MVSLGMSDGTPTAISRHAIPLVYALGVYSGLGQSFATLGCEVVLVPVPVDIARADEPLELFWRQLCATELPFQSSNDLVHAAYSPFLSAPSDRVTVGRGAMTQGRRAERVRAGGAILSKRGRQPGPEQGQLRPGPSPHFPAPIHGLETFRSHMTSVTAGVTGCRRSHDLPGPALGPPRMMSRPGRTRDV